MRSSKTFSGVPFVPHEPPAFQVPTSFGLKSPSHPRGCATEWEGPARISSLPSGVFRGADDLERVPFGLDEVLSERRSEIVEPAPGNRCRKAASQCLVTLTQGISDGP